MLLVLKSRPLSYISSKDVEEPLTPSHLLDWLDFFQIPDLLSEHAGPDFLETTNTADHKMKHMTKVKERLWTHWRHEYLAELRESHRNARVDQGTSLSAREGEVVTVHNENQPRGIWRLG